MLCEWMSDKEVRKNFRIGLKILNKANPNWYKKLKLREPIIMQDTRKCILGRVYGYFVDGLTALPELPCCWSECGFAGEWYAPLWMAEIRKRKAKDRAKRVMAKA